VEPAGWRDEKYWERASFVPEDTVGKVEDAWKGVRFDFRHITEGEDGARLKGKRKVLSYAVAVGFTATIQTVYYIQELTPSFHSSKTLHFATNAGMNLNADWYRASHQGDAPQNVIAHGPAINCPLEIRHRW
jgi:hypothetical protein